MADPEWVSMAVRAHCKYAVPGMDAVEVHLHIPYAARDGVTERYDVYGAVPGRSAKVVLLVHGGPIPDNLEATPADWGVFQSLARLLAASGVTAVMFNHRFFSPELNSAAMNDIEDLLAHLGAERVCLWVFSGGGSLLARFLRNTPANLRCVVAYYASLDAQPREFSAADAIEQNAASVPPILVARAGLDMQQLNDTIDHFVAVALKKNAAIEVMNHPAGRHGFDFSDDNPRTREILARTLDFIRTHLLAT